MLQNTILFIRLFLLSSANRAYNTGTTNSVFSIATLNQKCASLRLPISITMGLSELISLLPFKRYLLVHSFLSALIMSLLHWVFLHNNWDMSNLDCVMSTVAQTLLREDSPSELSQVCCVGLKWFLNYKTSCKWRDCLLWLLCPKVKIQSRLKDAGSW